MESLITPEMTEHFIAEAEELLDNLENDLIDLEKESSEDIISSALRALHSLKGNSGFMDFKDINTICHKAETLLAKVLEDNNKISSDQISVLLRVDDALRKSINQLKKGFSPEVLQLEELIKELINAEKNSTYVKTKPDKKDKITSSDKKTSQKQIIKTRLKAFVRVDSGKLNQLMDLISEIVISESMVSQNPDLGMMESQGLEKAITGLQKNVRELQELVTTMRMMPLSGLFDKMERLVRDLAVQHKKKVDISISGRDTEVDRSMIELVSDPIVHILRNAVDHGIELPKQRKQNKKLPHGKIDLSAKRVGPEIWIEVRDDGRGLDREKILKKAEENQLVLEGGENLPDQTVWNLIFNPNFSTAEDVTETSGRGVGMDIVNKNINKIKGKIEIESKSGEGTQFIIKIPLTTAIIDGMLLRIGDTLYAAPIQDIKESIKASDIETTELVNGEDFIKIREQMIPLVTLKDVNDGNNSEEFINAQQVIVIVESGNQRVGIRVDEIIGQRQIVIKPLSQLIGKMEGISGSAVLGNGDICLVLDTNSIVKNTFNNEINSAVPELENA